MAKIAIIGAGVMGTAFSFPLADNGHQVSLVGTILDDDIISSLRAGDGHPRLGVMPPGKVTPYFYHELAEALEATDLIVLGVSSAGINWAAEALSPHVKEPLCILALTKGLAVQDDHLRILPEVFCDALPESVREGTELFAIVGPCIAAELAVRRHTSVVLCGQKGAGLEPVAALLRTSYYHVWTSHDLVGGEACAALKNFYALIIGTAKGVLAREGEGDNGALTHNLAASMFAQALWEITYLVDFMGGDSKSVRTLPGAGDLYVTCQSGRNGRMGGLLGRGIPFDKAKADHMPDDTVEGAELAQAIAPTMRRLMREGRLDRAALPLMCAVFDIVCDGAPVDILWDQFFALETSKYASSMS